MLSRAFTSSGLVQLAPLPAGSIPKLEFGNEGISAVTHSTPLRAGSDRRYSKRRVVTVMVRGLPPRASSRRRRSPGLLNFPMMSSSDILAVGLPSMGGMSSPG